MSKLVKIFIGILSVAVIGGGAFLILRPKTDAGLIEKEISIKQAEIEKKKTKIHEDYAGFSFEYPGELSVQEVEIEDKTIYSSLEIKSIEGEIVTLKIADTTIKTIEDWQVKFEESNVVISIKDAFFSDLEAVTVIYGAPKKIKTVAVENNILYELISLADGGYYEKIHEKILNSFEFDESVYQESKPAGMDPVGAEDEDEDIILVEEILE